MKYLSDTSCCVLYVMMVLAFISCNDHTTTPSKILIDQLNLKRGNILSCGPAEKQFGNVVFDISGSEKVKQDFNVAVSLLHSFEYDESEKVFAKIIDESPDCAMAYWGVAMCNFHPLWTVPTEPELQKGNSALLIARNLKNKSERESAYIDALTIFYKEWKTLDHHTRCVSYEKAMQKIYKTFSLDKESAIFYALSLDASADPKDKTYSNQKKAATILNSIYPSEPEHPGIIHYFIHTYDYPGLAELALPFARKYAAVAPSSAHALHMPSHIFTRLGLWDECIASNLSSVAAAKCYAEQRGITGHWDEELHGLDYLEYAYLQKRDTSLAKQQLNYLRSIKKVYPVNFKVAYAFAAIPSRFYLETKDWQHAAALPIEPSDLPWKEYPWQEAIIHFSKLLGDVHIGKIEEGRFELSKLKALHDTLIVLKDSYKSGQVAIQIKAGEAWIKFANGEKKEALTDMMLAANMEDSTEKHPVTPGQVLPARELLGDMLMQQGNCSKALQAYQEVLQKCPNRFNSVSGAEAAASNCRKKFN